MIGWSEDHILEDNNQQQSYQSGLIITGCSSSVGGKKRLVSEDVIKNLPPDRARPWERHTGFLPEGTSTDLFCSLQARCCGWHRTPVTSVLRGSADPP